MTSKFQVARLITKIDAGLILAALLSLLIIQSLWQPGLPAAADAPIHLYRTLEYERAWAPGVIVPRWAPNLAYGYGYPLFVFAPPLPYLMTIFFHSTGLAISTALKSSIVLTILLYATGMYLMARDLFKSVAAGLVAATAYAFAPFALREALLNGGNLPQFLAIGLFPWTLWTMTRTARTGSWRRLALAAICYAGVFLSHLFQALVFTPVAGLYGLILLLRLGGIKHQHQALKVESRNPEASRAAQSLTSSHLVVSSRLRFLETYRPLLIIPVGLLLSAFFWLPAITERFYTRARAEIYLEKSPFFVRYPYWSELVAWIQPLDARAANPHVPLTLGLATIGLAGLGLLAGLWLLLPRSQEAKTQPSDHSNAVQPLFIFFFAAVAVASVFLSLPVSRPIWETVTILQVAEFPWRMLGLANLGLAVLAGAAALLPPPKLRWLATIIYLLLLLLSVAPFLYPVTPFVQYDQPTIADQIDYERRSQSIGTTTLGEYLPQSVSRPPTSSPLVDTFQANEIPERLDRQSLPEGAAAALIEQNAVTHRYQLVSSTPFTLRLFQFHYPGWQAGLDDRALIIRPEPETGLILIDIPAGEHTLTVHFGETPGRVLAMTLSGLTVLGLVAAGVVQFRRWRQSAYAQPLTIRPQGTASDWPHLPLNSVLVVSGMILITAGALWLKPLLRPIFTIESPPDQALPAQHQTQIDFAFPGQAGGIHLIGYDLSKSVIAPGEYLQVVLYWQTDAAPMQANLQPFVHLDRLNDFTTIADATNYTPGDVTTESNLPTFHWDNARYIRDEHDLIVPPTAAPIAFAVRVGLIDPDQSRLLSLTDGSGDTAQLMVINVSSNRQQSVPLARQLDTKFGNNQDNIYLTGFELSALTSEQLDFRLAWQASQRLDSDYTVFAQLLDSNQDLVASYDSPPLSGAYPTSTWLPDQTIIDPRYIPLGHVEPGQYQLVVGLYNPTTGRRLTTTDNADFVKLTELTIDDQ